MASMISKRSSILTLAMGYLSAITLAAQSGENFSDVIALKEYCLDSSFVNKVFDSYALTTQKEPTKGSAYILCMGHFSKVYEIPADMVDVAVASFHDAEWTTNRISGIGYYNNQTFLLANCPACFFTPTGEYVLFKTMARYESDSNTNLYSFCSSFIDTYDKKILSFIDVLRGSPGRIPISDRFSFDSAVCYSGCSAYNDLFAYRERPSGNSSPTCVIHRFRDETLIDRINILSSKTAHPLEIGNSRYGFYFDVKKAGDKLIIKIDRFYNVDKYGLEEGFAFCQYKGSPIFVFDGDYLLEETELQKTLYGLSLDELFGPVETSGAIEVSEVSDTTVIVDFASIEISEDDIYLTMDYYECTCFIFEISESDILIDTFFCEC